MSKAARTDPEDDQETSLLWRRRLCRRLCREEDLIREFLPFGFREYCVLDLHRSLRKAVTTLPDTRATFTVRDVVDAVPLTAKELAHDLDTHLYALGAWPADGFTGTREKWVNPGYVHAQSFASLTERDERRAYFEAVARLGLLPQHELTDPLGVETRRGVAHATESCGIDYRAERRAGQRRLARTWKTAHAYGWTLQALADIFDVPQGTVSGWITRHAGDWQVPANPMEEGSPNA